MSYIDNKIDTIDFWFFGVSKDLSMMEKIVFFLAANILRNISKKWKNKEVMECQLNSWHKLTNLCTIRHVYGLTKNNTYAAYFALMLAK